MQVVGYLGLAGLVAAVAGEICQNCSNYGLYFANLTILEEPDKVLVTAKPISPPSRLAPDKPLRILPASDEVLERCRQKGCMIDWAMHHSDNEVGPHYIPPRTTAQSPYQSWADLSRWFWHIYPHDGMNPVYDDLYAHWGIGWALDELGLSPYTDNYETGKNHITGVCHEDPNAQEGVGDQEYDVDGQRYRATGADYIMSINTEEGVVIAMNRKGPAAAGRERVPPITANGMPQLHQFSDVCWITWQDMARANGHDAKNLRYFVSISINNEETVGIIKRIFVDNEYIRDAWPGHYFDSDTDEFDAILGKSHLFRECLKVAVAAWRSHPNSPKAMSLFNFDCCEDVPANLWPGTPNMQGFGYMLVQHKAQLGNMFIRQFNVFDCNGGALCIIAHVSQPEAALEPGPIGIERRSEGHNIVREHKIFAKL